MIDSRNLSLVASKPLILGTGLIDDGLIFSAINLRCKWTSFGGCWSLGFLLQGPRKEMEDWFDAGLGRDIKLYSPGLSLIWEGFVSSMSLNVGALSKTRGPLLDIANRIRVVYSTVDTSTTPPTMGVRDTTAWADNVDSQAKYGVIERVMSVGGAVLSRATQIRDVALADFSEPPSDEMDNLTSSSMPSVSIECLGYFHWLNAYTVNLTTTGQQNANAKLQAVLAADPNGIFSTDYIYVDTNTTQVGAYDRDDRVALSVVKGLVALGDASNNRWLFGFGPDRKAYYRAVSSTVRYQRRLSDVRQELELYGSSDRVFPWNAQPGEWVFYTDFLTGRRQETNLRADLRHLFIEEATYTAPWGLTLSGSRLARLDQLLARLGLGGTHA